MMYSTVDYMDHKDKLGLDGYDKFLYIFERLYIQQHRDL